MKLAWKVLVGLGVLLVFISQGMDTTVSSGNGRVYNIGLQSQQQGFLILGCFMFLAGIILFGVFKIKETPEQEAEADRVRRAAVDTAKLQVEAVRKAVVGTADAHLAEPPVHRAVEGAKEGPDLEAAWQGLTHKAGWSRVVFGGVFLLVAVVAMLMLAGCSYFESMEKKQLNARVEGIKTALNDPTSFELLRSEHVKMGTGHRVVVNSTATKKVGWPSAAERYLRLCVVYQCRVR